MIEQLVHLQLNDKRPTAAQQHKAAVLADLDAADDILSAHLGPKTLCRLELAAYREWVLRGGE